MGKVEVAGGGGNVGGLGVAVPLPYVLVELSSLSWPLDVLYN